MFARGQSRFFVHGGADSKDFLCMIGLLSHLSHSKILLHSATKHIKFSLCKFLKKFKQLSSQSWPNLVELLSSGVSVPLEAVKHE